MEWNFALLCRRVVATGTHCARIATLLRWQNISLRALLISRPSYIYMQVKDIHLNPCHPAVSFWTYMWSVDAVCLAQNYIYINGYSGGRIECMCVGHTVRTTSNFTLHPRLSVINLLCFCNYAVSYIYRHSLLYNTLHLVLFLCSIPVNYHFFCAFLLKCYTVELFCVRLHCVYHHRCALSDSWTQQFGFSRLAACWVEWGDDHVLQGRSYKKSQKHRTIS
jgi:hypothetical protein